MNNSSKILLAIIFVLFCASVFVTYDRYKIQKDFPIFESEDGIPDELE